MKSAIVLLAAVTVFTTLFLESSSTPLSLNLGIDLGLGNTINKVGKGVEKTLLGVETLVDKVDKKVGKGVEKTLLGVETLVDKVDKKVKHVAAGVVDTVGTVVTNAKAKAEADKKTVENNVDDGIQSAEDKTVKDIQIVIDLLEKFADRKIKTCEETQSEVTVIIENLAADCEGKKDVTDLKVWWNEMKVKIAEIHNEVKNIFKTGSWENCDQVVSKINKACDDTKAKMDDSKAILPGDIYEIFEQRMGIILNCATDIVIGLEYVKLYPNEAKDLEEKFVDEKMKKCEETQAKLDKAIAAEEDLKQLQDWFKDLQVKIAGMHKNVKYTVDTGSWDSCDDIIDNIKTTCEKTKAKMTDFDKTLSDDMKEILKQHMGIIFDCAYDIVSSLECLKALNIYA